MIMRWCVAVLTHDIGTSVSGFRVLQYCIDDCVIEWNEIEFFCIFVAHNNNPNAFTASDSETSAFVKWLSLFAG